MYEIVEYTGKLAVRCDESNLATVLTNAVHLAHDLRRAFINVHCTFALDNGEEEAFVIGLNVDSDFEGNLQSALSYIAERRALATV